MNDQWLTPAVPFFLLENSASRIARCSGERVLARLPGTSASSRNLPVRNNSVHLDHRGKCAKVLTLPDRLRSSFRESGSRNCANRSKYIWVSGGVHGGCLGETETGVRETATCTRFQACIASHPHANIHQH